LLLDRVVDSAIDAWATCTQHVSLDSACTRAVCKWFRRNTVHL